MSMPQRPLPSRIAGEFLLVLGLLAGAATAAPLASREWQDVRSVLNQPDGRERYAPAGSEAPRDTRARSAWQDGLAAMETGRLDAAEEALKRAHALEPGAYAPVLAMADLALRRNRPADADRLMAQARQMAPNSAEVAAAAGRLALAQKRLPEAEKELRRAISQPGRLCKCIL